VDDDAVALLQHPRQKGAIQAHRGHQVLIQCLHPVDIFEDGETSRRSPGAANDVDDDVDAA